MSWRRLQGAPLAFAVRLGGRGLALLYVIVLARILGVHEYGIYAYAIAWAAILTTPAALGVEMIILRQTALYLDRGRPDLIRGVIRRSMEIVLPFAVFLMAIAAVVVLVAVNEIYVAAVLVILPTVLFGVWGRIWAGVLQGFGRTELGFAPSFVVLPVVMLVALGTLTLLGVDLDALDATLIFGGATLVSVLSAWIMARHFLNPVVAGAAVEKKGIGMRKLLGPFSLQAVIVAFSAQIGVLLLGAMDGASAAGIFQVSTKLAEPTAMLLAAITMSAAPKITGAFDRGDMDRLREIAARAARTCFLTSVPVALIVILFREPLLGIFGPGFTVGGTVLIVVVLAQLANSIAGPADVTLLMTAHGGAAVTAMAGGIVLNVVLCVVLIPSYGATGAAIALAIDILASRIAMAGIAWWKLDVNTTAFPLPMRPTRG